jgi:hypothetical protein
LFILKKFFCPELFFLTIYFFISIASLWAIGFDAIQLNVMVFMIGKNIWSYNFFNYFSHKKFMVKLAGNVLNFLSFP